jgi:outer membrane pore protein E
MKKSSLALMMMGLVASSATQAAEVYNKDGNKLDVRQSQSDALHQRL